MALDLTDAVSSVKTILSDNWTDTNTDTKTPEIEAVTDVKRFSGLTNNQDTLLIYEGKTSLKFDGCYWGSRTRTTPVSIDIRTTDSRAHFILMMKEVDRICNAKRKNPDANYNTLEPVEYVDLSDKRTGIFRAVYDIRVEARNEVI
jgi:CCR4-NOT transcriptional regulation complex NOT5 subunit